MENKHAYLIMCHNNFDQLEILLSLIDSEDNDIFIHIDKKSRVTKKEIDKIKCSISKSHIYFVDSIKAAWGSDSLMKIEIMLLNKAVETKHKYYHLISGADLPLKSQKEIHRLLDNDGHDYLSMDKDSIENSTKSFIGRVRYYFLLQNIIGRSSKINLLLRMIQWILIFIQKIFKIDRTKKANFEYVKGSQWFSITHNTAVLVLNKYPEYKKYFMMTNIPDECFIQTIIKNSDAGSNVVNDNLRYIDWSRGNPYTFKYDDFDELINSGKLFARKFDIKTDKDLIIKIKDYINKKQLIEEQNDF